MKPQKLQMVFSSGLFHISFSLHTYIIYICSRLFEELSAFFFFIKVDHTLNAGFRALDISVFKPTTVFHLNVFDWLKSYFSGHDYVALGIYDSKLHTAFCRINKELSKGPFLLDFFFSFSPQM